MHSPFFSVSLNDEKRTFQQVIYLISCTKFREKGNDKDMERWGASHLIAGITDLQSQPVLDFVLHEVRDKQADIPCHDHEIVGIPYQFGTAVCAKPFTLRKKRSK